ncbi:hypothetical protein BYT27DRAFT_7199653 [Phlegmacium glaucopus]|nr:hypothetical protein BYT27DRAFT_7199653 [Phlegmacium glaucopus]
MSSSQILLPDIPDLFLCYPVIPQKFRPGADINGRPFSSYLTPKVPTYTVQQKLSN